MDVDTPRRLKYEKDPVAVIVILMLYLQLQLHDLRASGALRMKRAATGVFGRASALGAGCCPRVQGQLGYAPLAF